MKTPDEVMSDSCLQELASMFSRTSAVVEVVHIQVYGVCRTAAACVHGASMNAMYHAKAPDTRFAGRAEDNEGQWTMTAEARWTKFGIFQVRKE